MKQQYLIDTQCWLWWHICPEKLSQKQYDIIEDTSNKVYFSVASAWEITLKYRLKKLKLPSVPSNYILRRIERSQMTIAEILLEHSLYVENLPLIHTDLFDRFIISQAQLGEMTILTNDHAFKLYDVPLIL